ncbi:hypothetical protein CJF25_16330 [Photobacterium phosphoreum]|uniref:ComEC/Rec2 family competence protein n=1 Tax=Photobacterium phosphoreum TaxID=659 RepID=UPI001E285433|nr:MBL fold metallo-hydrolase [Photobacterium phosphoreum]MCD9464532.1 hypothetical protein [Photobacterium phosphoreum]
MMCFKVLKANNGDCLLISVNVDGTNRNILIDGGTSATYVRERRKGDLYNTLAEIKKNGEKIDLLILSHVDDDHIAGLLKGFKNSGLLTELTNKVWFNSGSLIDESVGCDIESSHLVEFDYQRTETDADNYTSIKQGITFESFISDNNIWCKSLICEGAQYDFFGATIKVLSPTPNKLNKLLVKWEKEEKKSKSSASNTDYNLTFEELLKDDQFKKDSSVHNGSSIAFLFEYQNTKLLLLADAHDDVIVSSIRNLKDDNGQNYSEHNPLIVDYVKLSHHASSYNTSPTFLSLIRCDNFIISTDGSYHGLPNKLTLARVASKHPNAKFLFNYPNLIEQIFLPSELDSLKKNGYSFESCDEFFKL